MKVHIYFDILSFLTQIVDSFVQPVAHQSIRCGAGGNFLVHLCFLGQIIMDGNRVLRGVFYET